MFFIELLGLKLFSSNMKNLAKIVINHATFEVLMNLSQFIRVSNPLILNIDIHTVGQKEISLSDFLVSTKCIQAYKLTIYSDHRFVLDTDSDYLK